MQNVMLFANVLYAYCKQFGFGHLNTCEEDFRYCLEKAKDKMDFLGLSDNEILTAVKITRTMLEI